MDSKTTAKWNRVDAQTGEILIANTTWEEARVSAYRIETGRMTRLVRVR